MPLRQLQQVAKGWQLRGEKIVFTNGCFDLLHPGHIEVLLAAANQGNRLVVGLNSDASVRQLKGAGRPVMKEQERAVLLAAQTFVDAVTLFEETTPLHLIQSLCPDVLVKGGDYRESDIVGGDWVKAYHGTVVIVPLLEGYATTSLVQRVKNLPG